MTPDELHAARRTLGELWGKSRPEYGLPLAHTDKVCIFVLIDGAAPHLKRTN